ncbi:Pectinesterase inhibitor domain containing protein [Trema orientale]|uniref:Pectinesterase inhibitor domain containing protein n=1 Tax=Trema orientale TaxID=63057 RepID=A0A2P5F5Y6_TREOI|nr:Pectinesterase inhibitor domain containing protein [Trema orientale]
MERNHGGRAPHLFLFLFLFFSSSLVLFDPTFAICVPRNYSSQSHPQPQTPPSPVSLHRSQTPPPPPPVSHISAPAPTTKPPPENPSPVAKTPSTSALIPNGDTNVVQLDGLKGSLFSRPFLPFPVQPLTNPNPGLKKLCDSTDYPSLCVSSLTPFMSKKVDAVSLLLPAIKAATQHAKLSLAAASKLAAAPGASEGLVAALGSCKESYNDALVNLQSAAEAAASGDVGTVNSMVSAVVTDSENCEDAFEEESPLFDYDDKLRKMASNCLAIASLVN